MTRIDPSLRQILDLTRFRPTKSDRCCPRRCPVVRIC